MRLPTFALLAALVSCQSTLGERPIRSSDHDSEDVPAESAETGAPGDSDSHEAAPHVESAEPEPETLEDDPEDAASDETGRATRPHPLDGLSDADIGRAVAEDPAKLGSISLGAPSAGLLLNGVQAAESPFLKPVSPSGAFGTEETLGYLESAIKRVHGEFPDTPPLALGDISSRKGGRFKPHISHQSGRDVDISFYYRDGAQWYRRGSANNLDIARNWAFVRALLIETDVEMILVDHSIQALLREHAIALGEDPAWVEALFRGGPGLRPILRHAPGHATHFHIRFFNPIAQETARRAYRHLVSHGLVPPVQDYTSYRAKRGDTLGKLAKRFGTSVDAIKRANGLKKSLIREKQVYLIPTASSRPKPPPPQLTFPPRRLPPKTAPAP